MVAARAALRHQVPVVLQHIEVVVAYDAVDFFQQVVMGCGVSDVDCLALELFGLPVGPHIGDTPIANLGIMHVQRAGFGIESGLGPINPDAEAQSFPMRSVGNESDAVRKLFRIGIPVSHAAEPSGIDVKHLYAEFLGFMDHAQCKRLIDSHTAAPTVVDDQRIVLVFPCGWIAEDLPHPGAELIAGSIAATNESAKKYRWRNKAASRLDPRAKRAGIWIQSED